MRRRMLVHVPSLLFLVFLPTPLTIRHRLLLGFLRRHEFFLVCVLPLHLYVGRWTRSRTQTTYFRPWCALAAPLPLHIHSHDLQPCCCRRACGSVRGREDGRARVEFKVCPRARSPRKCWETPITPGTSVRFTCALTMRRSTEVVI